MVQRSNASTKRSDRTIGNGDPAIRELGADELTVIFGGINGSGLEMKMECRECHHTWNVSWDRHASSPGCPNCFSLNVSLVKGGGLDH